MKPKCILKRQLRKQWNTNIIPANYYVAQTVKLPTQKINMFVITCLLKKPLCNTTRVLTKAFIEIVFLKFYQIIQFIKRKLTKQRCISFEVENQRTEYFC